MAEVELECAVYGEGTVFPVKIARDAKVSALQEAIFDKERYRERFSFSASALTLYLARKNGEWLMDDHHVKSFLQAGISTEYEEMRPSWRLKKKELLGPNFEPGEEEIHVLVELPKEEDEEVAESTAKRQRVGAPEWMWNEEEEPTYFLTGSAMFFVNRDRATEQLQDIHRLKYNRAMNNSGEEWEIPIVDNVFGLGKSTFGDEYIQKCRKQWPGPADANAGTFMPLLRACHTIHINFEPGDLIHEEHFETKMIELICDFFDVKFAAKPRALAPKLVASTQTSRQLLKKLTAEVGPLFIVLDEIGKGFEGPLQGVGDFGKREQFLRFCVLVLATWLSIPKVFFLIAGRASFLSFVGMRPVSLQKEISPSPFNFRRLSLHRLRRAAIEQIINKTFVDEVEMKTIKEHFCLDDKQVTKVARCLFDTTFGHPRSLIAAFRKCRSYDELVAYEVSDQPDCIDWAAFAERMQSYAKPIERMMSLAIKAEPVNLAQIWKDKGNKEISYDTIVNSFGIAWDGTVEEAKLYMPLYLRQLILAFLYPFREYLDKVASCRISPDYSTVFEWACLKRFQELFDENSQRCPHKVLPEFFTDQQQFGACTEVQFAKHPRPMPKITAIGNSEPSLDTQTALPEKWPILLTAIDKVLMKEYRLTLKSRPKSASSDALLMTMMQTTKLTVGLAVKNYARGTSFGETPLIKECKLFNRMFTTSDDRLNVLIVCSTNYSDDLNKKFDTTESEGQKIVRNSAVYSTDGFPNIHEIILLNLSTPEQRAKFFSIQDEALRKTLESIIEKTEVEFDSKE